MPKSKKRGGKRQNAGRKKQEIKKTFKTFSVLESDFNRFSTVSKKYQLSNNVLFTMFLDNFLDVLKKKLDNSKNSL